MLFVFLRIKNLSSHFLLKYEVHGVFEMDFVSKRQGLLKLKDAGSELNMVPLSLKLSLQFSN